MNTKAILTDTRTNKSRTNKQGKPKTFKRVGTGKLNNLITMKTQKVITKKKETMLAAIVKLSLNKIQKGLTIRRYELQNGREGVVNIGGGSSC